jgi:heme/copper-type cytochrome/quinol oxidase subunit 2
MLYKAKVAVRSEIRKKHINAMWRFISCSLASLIIVVVPYFSTLYHKRQDFRKKKETMEHEVCVLIFSTALSETFLILRRIE